MYALTANERKKGENVMLTITVNGQTEKLNIGCRTFISLDLLLKILESEDQQVTLNGEAICNSVCAKTIVNSGDTLELT